MTSATAVLTGRREPRFRLAPAEQSPAGQLAIELAASAGLILDPWQQDVLHGALAEGPDDRWAASEVGLIVPRQNGKGGILEARELAGLFLFDEELIIHSAHEVKTSKGAYRRIRRIIQSTPDLARRVKQYRFSNEEISIELWTEQKLQYLARSSGSGRGFTGNCVIFDEAYNLSAAMMSALIPTLSAQPNTQIWYTSSAPLPRQESDTLRRLCKRGRLGARKGEPGRLAYNEWSATDDAQLDDREAWADSNPSLGVHRKNHTGITEEGIETELGALEAEDFARERLGIFPEDLEGTEAVIDPDDWKACTDANSKLIGQPVLVFEVSQDRKWSVIAAVGASSTGGTHVEVVENRPRTGWVVNRLVELKAKHNPEHIICNPTGPAGGLLADCERVGLDITEVKGNDYTQACQAAYDDITEHRWHHIGQASLTAAATGAAKRPQGDAWVFDRRGQLDISPLTAVALGAWQRRPKPRKYRAIGY